ncbi:Flagellum site-determining protein YlxH [Candidatus Rubidus massiliensis]|nr:Flagellum site-determining protein YlxH [Candidatus Rubidus massiliensis]
MTNAFFAKQVFLIGSGKGGVGKSTVAVNLSVACARQGLRVGLLDADIYGPSIPIMMGLRSLSPCIQIDKTGLERIIPFAKFGIRVISMGFFLEESRSMTLRGPALHTALEKMIKGVEWGELDVLIVDLPPGTGDIPISLSKLIPIDGALIVSTPQEVAMLDAMKAINAFYQLEIPINGVIENMGGFTVPGTNQVFHIFGEGKAKELADRFDVPFLGSIPLIPAIRTGCDEGYPAAYHMGNDHAGQFFHLIASTFINENIAKLSSERK